MVNRDGFRCYVNEQGEPVDQDSDEALDQNLEIARAYRIIDKDHLPKENWFYLQHGAIALPYLEQEETYARFEGHPLDLKLEIETRAVHKVSESGLLDRLTAALAMKFAPGVDIDKIRSGKRTVAGIKGEELIMRGTEGGETELSFTWLFPGEKDSREHPKISIEMESPDGQLEEKLKIWDAILDSMQAVRR